MPKRPPLTIKQRIERTIKIVELRAKGASLREISYAVDLSKERVRQILLAEKSY